LCLSGHQGDRVTYLYKGIAAGLMGALVLSAYLLLNIETGWMPALDFVSLAGQLTGTGMVGGWVIHFIVGGLLGALFAWLDPDLPGDSLRQRGIVLATVVWLLMMFFAMPYAGYGVFGLKQSVLLPVGALVLHLIFGIIMGGTYSWLVLQGRPLRYKQARERTPVRPVRAEEVMPANVKPSEATPTSETVEPAVHVPTTVEVVRPSTVPLVPNKTVPMTASKRQRSAARRQTNGSSAPLAESRSRPAPVNGSGAAPTKTVSNESGQQPNR
jgi:hypothetical protein